MPWWRLLGGSGRLPDHLRAAYDREGVLELHEGLPGTTTYRRYRQPGEYSSWSREPTTGAVVVTRRRFVVWTRNRREVDVPVGRPLPAGLSVTAEPDRLVVHYDAGAFHADRRGEVEVRLRTPYAHRLRAFLG